MATIKRLESSRIVMYFSDHPPPHVHVKLTQGRDCTVDLATLRINGPVEAREIREALAWIRSNREHLEQLWRERVA